MTTITETQREEFALCEIHYPGAEILGLITPRLAVLEFKGRYILFQNDHGCGQALVSFEVTPKEDPVTPEIEARTDATLEANVDDTPEDDEALRASIEWGFAAETAMKPLSELGWKLESAWDFVQDIKANTNWDRDVDGLLEIWLYGQIAAVIAQHTGTLARA